MVIKVTSATEITCPKYEAAQGGKRCKHYGARGTCALPDELMCVEWLRVNEPEAYKRQAQSLSLVRTNDPLVAPSDPLAAPVEADRPTATTGANGAQRPAESEHGGLMATPSPLDPELINDEALEALEASGLECRIASADLDDVWLVPEFTDQDRHELPYRFARTLLVTMSIFPGASLREIKRKNQEPRNQEP